MSGPHYVDVEFAPKGQNAQRICAVATFEPQEAQIPYRREVAVLRCREGSRHIQLGMVLTFCDRRWVAFDIKHRPGRGWATVQAAFLAPEASSNAIWAGNVKILRPEHYSGLNARTEHVEAGPPRPAVIATMPKTLESLESGRQTVGKYAIYLDRVAVVGMAPDWAIEDGTRHFRVDAVGDFTRLDVLPYAAVTLTGNRV